MSMYTIRNFLYQKVIPFIFQVALNPPGNLMVFLLWTLKLSKVISYVSAAIVNSLTYIFKIVAKYIKHKISHFNYFKMYGSLILNVFTLLGNNHHSPSLELCLSF